MFYSKLEKYSFSMPGEFKAYLAFKEHLAEVGVKFVDCGGHNEQVIETHTTGRFTIDDNGHFTF